MRWKSRLAMLRQLASDAHVAAKHRWYSGLDLSFTGQHHPVPDAIGRYIEAANPVDVLSLLDELEEMEGVLRRVRGHVAYHRGSALAMLLDKELL